MAKIKRVAPKQHDFSTYHEPIDFKRPWRIFKIMSEFVEGYDFVSKFSRVVTILGSARTKPGTKWYKEAEKLGFLLGNAKYTVMTGGGPGIMEAGNKGAYATKTKSIGINIKLPFEQILNPYVTDAEGFHYFFTRKVMLLGPAQAFVFFPGGYGTMDEFFEVVDLMETGFLQEAPVIAVGKDFWTPIVDGFLRNQAVRQGILEKKQIERIHIVDSADEAFAIVKKAKDVRAICDLSSENFLCENEINWRIFRIMAELVEGFDTVTTYLDDITVLGSKAVSPNSEYYQQAYKLGLELGKNKRTVITGGGPGVTEAVNKGAFEAGSTSLGLIMQHDHKQQSNPYLNAHSIFHFPFTRKLIITAPSNAFVIFPGGLGTLHQTFELLTLMQTGKSHKIPVIFYDRKYWQPLLDYIEDVLMKKYKTISPGDEDLYRVVDNIDEAIKIIKKLPREGHSKREAL